MTTATKTKRTKRRKKHTLRCGANKTWQRLLCSLPGYDPFDQAEDCWFDAGLAGYYIDFIEQCCSHIEGALAGRPFILERWERAIVANLFGWQRFDAYGRQVRRYREAFIYVPRKNGKTPLGACLMNVAFFLDDEAGQQNFCAAGERDQAALSFRHIDGMQKAEIEMASRVKDYVATKTIVRHEDKSFIKVLSSEADTKHGGNPHIILIDELHVQKNRHLIDVFQTAMASLNRKQPLMIHLTTADYVRESICNEKYEYACRIRDGIIKDITFLPVIYEAAADDDWTKVSTWKKANPNLGVSVSIDFMKRECKRAQEVPTYENTFKRLHLNIRTEQDVRWLPMELWNSCDFAADEDELAGRRCWAAFDLSTNTDIAGYGLLFEPVEEDERWKYLCRLFVPRENAEKREDRDRVPYITWAKDGLLTLTGGNVVDYDVIQAAFWADARRFDIAEIAFDRWGFEAFRQRFISDGIEEEKFVSFGQGYASMSAPAKELEKMLLAKELAHGGHPVLAWMASNVSVDMDPAGNIKPSKKSSIGRIDGVVMLIMCIGRAMQSPEQKASVYETRGILTIGGE